MKITDLLPDLCRDSSCQEESRHRSGSRSVIFMTGRIPFSLYPITSVIRAQKYEVLGQLRQSESTFFVTGYLPKKQVPAMEKRLTEKYDIVFEAEDADGENVPVALQNSRFGAAGEGVVQRLVFPERERSIRPPL